MKQIILVGIFIWLLCTANHCERPGDDCHKTINFVNLSSKEVYIFRSGYGNYGIPDTSLFDIPYLSVDDKVKPNETNTYALCDRYCLEHWFGEERNSVGINVFVLDAEVVESVPQDTIFKYRMLLKTIYPSIEELESNNWTITYTGE